MNLEKVSFKMAKTVKGVEVEHDVIGFIDEKDPNQREFKEGIQTVVFSRVVKSLKTGKYLHFELLLPDNHSDFVEVFGEVATYELAVRSMITNHKNWLASADLAKPIGELKKAFVHFKQNFYTKRFWNERAGKVTSAEKVEKAVESMTHEQLQKLIEKAQARLEKS